MRGVLFFFSVEILVASLERNSHPAQVQIFRGTAENKNVFWACVTRSHFCYCTVKQLHCYIYLPAYQPFTLILAYLLKGMWMGSHDTDSPLLTNEWLIQKMGVEGEMVMKLLVSFHLLVFLMKCRIRLVKWSANICNCSWNSHDHILLELKSINQEPLLNISEKNQASG